jgi:hypothetical protein
MWKKVISDKKLQSEMVNKIDEIFNILNNEDLINRESTGLLIGQSGILLFHNYYNHYKNIERYEFNEAIILNLFNNINRVSSYSSCSGWSGLLLSLNTLKADNFINIDQDIFIDTKEMLEQSLILYSKNKNHDYLHGSFGVALYLLQQPEIIENKIFNEWLRMFLAENEDRDNMLFRKTMVNAITQEEGYCLGLAHGVPSIILIMIKYLEKFDDPLGKEILNKSINYLLSNKFPKGQSKKSIFPSLINDDGPLESQLAWCYGDLGCSLALYKAGVFLKEPLLVKQALETLTHTAKRRSSKELVNDPDFCHGSVGIAHFFSRFYNYTGVEEFREASEYWYTQTIEKAVFKDGLAGYKHIEGEGLVNRSSLLEGIAGIGLSFMSAISNKEPKWDNCLLLS